MRLDWAVACRYAEVTGNVASIVGAGIDTFWMDELPGSVQFFIAIRLAASEEEFGPENDHELKIELLGPDMNDLGELLINFTGSGASPLHEPGWEVTTMVPALVKFVAPADGTYSFAIYLDDEYKKTIPILIRAGPPL